MVKPRIRRWNGMWACGTDAFDSWAGWTPVEAYAGWKKSRQKQRWDREKYNEYMRKYMAKRRAAKKEMG